MNPKLRLKVFPVVLLTVVQVLGMGGVARSTPVSTISENLETQGVCVTMVEINGTSSSLTSPVDTAPQPISTKTLPQAVQILRDPNSNKICDAASYLAKGGQPAISAVTSLLNDSEAVIRLRALIALGEMRELAKATAIPSILPLLKDPEPVIRYRTISLLHGIDVSPDTLIPLLVPLLKDSDAKVRLQAASTLFSFPGEPTQLAIPVLVALLKYPNKNIQTSASVTFEFGLERSISALPLLRPLLKDPDIDVRSRAAKLIGKIREIMIPEQTYPMAQESPVFLVPNLECSHWKSEPSLEAEREAKRKTPISVINRTIQALRDANESEKCGVIDSIQRIGEPAVIYLVPLLTDQNADVRLKAMNALANIGRLSGPAISALIPLLQDQDRRVRVGAAETLLRIGAVGRLTIPDLIPLLQDHDEWVKSTAAEALKKLGYKP
jgi:HEAT repeat protein